jgi:hypothetical protein
MSFSPEKVVAVLLADGWHKVQGTSFRVEEAPLPRSRTHDASPNSGFRFAEGVMTPGSLPLFGHENEPAVWISGPTESIIALKSEYVRVPDLEEVLNAFAPKT